MPLQPVSIPVTTMTAASRTTTKARSRVLMTSKDVSVDLLFHVGATRFAARRG
jgi:hypothetical protein